MPRELIASRRIPSHALSKVVLRGITRATRPVGARDDLSEARHSRALAPHLVRDVTCHAHAARCLRAHQLLLRHPLDVDGHRDHGPRESPAAQAGHAPTN